jgi:hypothetical protein
MEKVKVLFELPLIPDMDLSDVSFGAHEGNSTIELKYESGGDFDKTFQIKIRNVYKFLFTSDSCCKPFQMEHAYETVVSVNNSSLIEEVRKDAELLDILIDKETKHFMLYLPDYGCYEFIAEDLINNFD